MSEVLSLRKSFSLSLLFILFLAPIASGKSIDFSAMGTFRDTRFIQSGMTITAESNIPLLYFLKYNGVGVVGGGSDSMIDTGEAITFSFRNPATQVSFFVQSASNGDSDSLIGEAWVEGYGADGSLVGVYTISGLDRKDISPLFGTPLSAFRVLAKDQDSIRISSVSYNLGSAIQTVVFSEVSN